MQQHSFERLLQYSSLSFLLQKLTQKEHFILQKQKEYFSVQGTFSFFELSSALVEVFSFGKVFILFDISGIFPAELSIFFSFIWISLL
jgi:hypothetical protein